MEKIWSDPGPHEVFLRELMNSRVDELVNSPGWLKRMRYRNEEVLWWNKRAGYIFEERGLNLYQLIAEAHGECWDNEDEEKSASAKSAGLEQLRCSRPTSSRAGVGLPPPRPGGEKNVPPMGKEPQQKEDAVSLDHPRQIGVRLGQKEECEVHVRSSNEGC